MTSPTITGSEVKAARRKAGMNQTQMAERIGVARGAVSYWERKTAPFTANQIRFGALARMLDVLGNEALFGVSTRARSRGVTDEAQERINAKLAKWEARLEARIANRRVKCGAKTRKGSPCRLSSEPGKRRCKFHGGRSTGPRTAEGKARIAEAQRKRWQAYRAEFSCMTENSKTLYGS